MKWAKADKYLPSQKLEPAKSTGGFFASSLGLEVVGMVGVDTRIPPGDVHLARGQVYYQSIDGFLAVQRVIIVHGVVADRIRVVHMVALYGLQGFYGMLFGLLE